MRTLTEDEIEPLATGAWILGAGGGGSPYDGFLNLRELYRQGTTVELMQPDELADDDLVAVVSTMGAPLVGQERLADPELSVKPVLALQDYLGEAFRAVMPVEIGGGNGLEPFLVAAGMGIPVVDADAMGRAFPEAQMTSFSIHELPMFPLALGDIRDNAVIVTRAASWTWMERLSRAVCTALGSTAPTAKAPRTGREVKDCAILHSVTKAIRIGRTVHEARVRHDDPVGALLDAEDGRLLFQGKITDINRRTTGGFLRGDAVLDGIGPDAESRFEIAFQNEYLMGWRDGEATVMVPDIICLMDSESGEAVGTETLRYGQRISVTALPAPDILSSQKGLEIVGPRAFGYDTDYRSAFDD
ncbi:MAG: hypothetical protein CMM46_00685 [Rhodospirillaceae bacterium]|nr:hypothetical protein [Rhodospirillaceae bacterium]|tara:strand:+ start:3766 stop:4842 length:1077 start_codon:yes stop_codon:yes gene_type:complete